MSNGVSHIVKMFTHIWPLKTLSGILISYKPTHSYCPPLPHAVLNGSSHSPTSLNGAPSTPNGFSNGPAMSSTASLSNQQLPPACGARQLCKLKRFLTTLQQFGNDISPEIGERVRSLVLGLVVSSDSSVGIILKNCSYCTFIHSAPFPFLTSSIY